MMETAVAVAVGAVAIYGMLTVMNTLNKSGNASRTTTGRNAVVNNIRRFAANPAAVNQALSNLPAGTNCIATNTCANNQSLPLALYDANNNPLTSGPGSPGPNNVMSYNADGSSLGCPIGGSVTCPILAGSYAIVRCGAGGCGSPAAVTIETHYTVWQSPLSYPPLGPGGGVTFTTVSAQPIPISAQDVNNVCSAQTVSNCQLPVSANGSDIPGKCTASGTCSYTCVNGQWKQASSSDTNTCS